MSEFQDIWSILRTSIPYALFQYIAAAVSMICRSQTKKFYLADIKQVMSFCDNLAQ